MSPPPLLCALLLLLFGSSSTRAYTQVAWQRAEPDAGPRIYKALNADLIFPKIFNATEMPPAQGSPDRPTTAAETTTTTTTTSVPTAANYAAYHYQQQQQQQQQQEQAAGAATVFVTPSSAAHDDRSSAANNNDNNYSNHRYTDELAYDEGSDANSADGSSMQPLPRPTDTLTGVEQQQQQQQDDDYFAGQPEFAATGRAVDSQPSGYQLSQLITPLIQKPPRAPPPQRPLARPANYGPRPQRPPPAIMQRFSPGEAVASQLLLGKHRAHKTKKGNAAAYVPPRDLYAFPPNVNAKYPAPGQDPKAAVPSGKVNSYSAPPSGPLSNSAGYPLVLAATSNEATTAYKYNKNNNDDGGGYGYSGPLHPGYLPPTAGDATKDDMDSSVGVLPASAMMDAADDASDEDDDKSPPVMMDDMAAEHGHDHDDGKEYPTPPPGWVEEHPESDDNHDHGPSMSHGYHGWPDIIYDHDHDHDHHHHHHPLPPPPIVTTSAPPPEPPPEPRVKKYSYFYIGRKLWYIPLYFTVWFSFYVLWLIVKSIARHKVNLPNHYVAKRSLDDPPPTAADYINQLTVKVLRQIDEYGSKLQAEES